MLSNLNSHVHLQYSWLVTASFLAGGMNAMAGGGSFLSFPAMLAMGVPPVQANATNTVALWPGQATSIWALRDDLRRDLLPAVLVASVAGGVSGAVILLKTKQATFLHLVPWLLLVAALLFWISGPVSRWLRRRSSEPHAERKVNEPLLFVMLLPVCFYIGYFGAGGGFLVMTALALLGLEKMHELNSLKVVTAGISNLSAVFTFILKGAVLWHYCVISMVFAAVGGYVGAQYARKMNAQALRTTVVATGLIVAGYFFWKLR